MVVVCLGIGVGAMMVVALWIGVGAVVVVGLGQAVGAVAVVEEDEKSTLEASKTGVFS